MLCTSIEGQHAQTPTLKVDHIYQPAAFQLGWFPTPARTILPAI